MKNFVLSCFAMLLAVTLIGCGESNTDSSQTDKKPADSSSVTKKVSLSVCPLCAMDVNPKVATTAFDGKTIGFCNDGCKKHFDELSDDEKKKMIADVSKKIKEDDHDHDHDHEHEKEEKKAS